MLEEESRSKMIQKQKDPMMFENKVNTKPVDCAALNQLLQDFETRFVPQTALSAEHVFCSQNSVNSEKPNLSTRPTQVEVPKELPKVSMVNSSLKKLKYHLASFDVVVKERTTAIAITEGTSKDEASDFIIKFLKMIHVRLKVGISHETSVARSSQQNDVVERRNRKLQPKDDIGIFIGYAPTKMAFRIYNRRTRRIVDELTAMASEQSSSGPVLHEMTPT
nr:hypothetical protein [Tanacetum cinerariifolium]